MKREQMKDFEDLRRVTACTLGVTYDKVDSDPTANITAASLLVAGELREVHDLLKTIAEDVGVLRGV